MPFRLLGLVADPNRVEKLGAGVLGAYAASGTTVTIVSADRIETLTEAIIRHRPHVVVIDPVDAHWREAAIGAFSLARGRLRFVGEAPAKLYFHAAPPIRPGITTAVATGHHALPELFIRAYPQPWVTGVLEHDLFLGLKGEGRPTLAELLAS